MALFLRRLLSCCILLAILLASAIVPVLILLGIRERWFWFVPYAVLVAFLVYLLARADRDGVAVPAARSGFGRYLATHLTFAITLMIHLALLLAKWIGSLPAVPFLPETAALAMLAIAIGRWLLESRPFFRNRPLVLEMTFDVLAVISLFAGVLAMTFVST